MRNIILAILLISVVSSKIDFLPDNADPVKACPKFECKKTAGANGVCQEFSGKVDDGSKVVKEYTCDKQGNDEYECIYESDPNTILTQTDNISCTKKEVIPPIPPTRGFAGESCTGDKAVCSNYTIYKNTGSTAAPVWTLSPRAFRDCVKNTCEGNIIGEPCDEVLNCVIGSYCDTTQGEVGKFKGKCKANKVKGTECTDTEECDLGMFCYETDKKQCIDFFSLKSGEKSPSPDFDQLVCRDGHYINSICVTIHNKLKDGEKLVDGVKECNIGDKCEYYYKVEVGTAPEYVAGQNDEVSDTCVCGYNSQGKGYCSYTHDNADFVKVQALNAKNFEKLPNQHNSRRYTPNDLQIKKCSSSYSSQFWVAHHKEDCELAKDPLCKDLMTNYIQFALVLLLSVIFMF